MLVTGLRLPGINVGLKTGLNGLYGTWSQLTNGTDLAAAMEFANNPTSMWKMDEAANATDLEGSNNLVDVNSPAHLVNSPALKTTTVQFTENSTESLDAANSTILDVGNESFALLSLVEYLGGNTADRSVMAKRGGGGVAGYENSIRSAGHVRFIADVGASNLSRTITIDHTGHCCMLAVVDLNINEGQVWSNLGSSGSIAPPAGSFTSTSTFALGNRRITAPDALHALHAIWVGTDAEGLNGTHLANLICFLGLN